MPEHEQGPRPAVDYRFTLANERTFLAYVRTALALDAAGLAAAQFLTDVGTEWLRRTVAIALVAAGTLVAVAAHRRWAGNDAAMRAGTDLPRSALPLLLAVMAALISVAALALVLVD